MELHNGSIEKSILSSIFFEPKIMERLATLPPTLFFDPYYKKIFEACLELFSKEKPIDESLILRKFKKDANIESSLIEILAANPLSNVESYIHILEELAKKRNIHTFALRLLEDLKNDIETGDLETAIMKFSEEPLRDSQAIQIHSAYDLEEEEIEFYTKKWLPIPKITVSMFAAPGGTGKTYLLLLLALRVVKEMLPVDPSFKIFAWMSEDPLGETKKRLSDLLISYFQNDKSLLKHIDISKDLTPLFLIPDVRKNDFITNDFYKFKSFVKKQGYKLLILDPMLAFFGGDENNNVHAKRFVQAFTEWCDKEGITVIFVHHADKEGKRSRGASAFEDAVRMLYYVETIKDAKGDPIKNSKDLSFKIHKENYGARLLVGSAFKRKIFPAIIEREIIGKEDLEDDGMGPVS